MVLYDDKKWLCRLIRTAFTIEDDTGVCEKVLKTKVALPPVGYQQDGDSSSYSSDDSFDIREGADLGHRRRSNTAIRLEKLEKQKKAQNLTQVVRVHNPVEAPKNPITFVKDTDYKKRAQLSWKKAVRVDKLLESVPDPDAIPFATYARFDALGHPGTPFKRMSIFLPFLPPEHRPYPLRIAVVATAKVIDLIGLTLWMASQAYPNLAKDFRPINYHSLQIADEDGEWDTDFPPMEPLEPVSKFSFSHLALVKCEDDHAMQYTMTQLKVHLTFLLPNGSIYKMQVENAEVLLADVLTTLLQRSGWGRGFMTNTAPKEIYHLEKLGDHTTEFTDLSLTIADVKCKDFCLVRNGAKSVQSASAKPDSKAGFGSPAEVPGARSSLYPVIVSTGRFNRVKNALCVIWGGQRMDLEFQHKTKSYPLSSFSGVKYDQMKSRVVISMQQAAPSTPLGAHYLTGSSHLTLTTADRQVSTELYHHLLAVIGNKY